MCGKFHPLGERPLSHPHYQGGLYLTREWWCPNLGDGWSRGGPPLNQPPPGSEIWRGPLRPDPPPVWPTNSEGMPFTRETERLFPWVISSLMLDVAWSESNLGLRPPRPSYYSGRSEWVHGPPKQAQDRLTEAIARCWRLQRRQREPERLATDAACLGVRIRERKLELVATGLFEALRIAWVPQTWRWHRNRWITGPDGARRMIVPRLHLRPDGFLAWLTDVTLRHAKEHLPRFRVPLSAADRFALDPASSSAAAFSAKLDVEGRLADHIDAARVRAASRKLPAGQRKAVEAVYFRELSRAEAAAECGVSLSALDNRLHHARMNLRALI